MNVVIIYDDYACAVKAKAMFDRAAHRANEVLRWTVKPWRLDMLARPLTAGEALTDAADAHLVVLTVRHPLSLPGWVPGWLEQWAARRQVPDAALAVWDGGNGDTLSASAAPDLSQFAQRHGLSFISGDAGPIEDEAAVPARRLTRRQALATPAPQPILERAPVSPASDWGINE